MKTPIDRSLRAAGAAVVLAGAALDAARGQVAPTPSPEANAADQTIVLQTFTVTGSHIARLEQEKTLPVTVIDHDTMEIRDAAQPSDLLTALPQVTGLPGNETSTLGAGARGDNASVSLRGIPSSNTLVLLNGRRLAPHPISQSEGGVPALPVNVNQIPGRVLDRIDVLRDGASSVYGTDAVAGVVNYISRRNFVGTEVQLRFAQTNHDDGQEYRATITHGLTFAGRKGRLLLSADFYDRAAMYARDRSFSAEADNSARAPAPWNVATDTTFNLRSATTAYGNFSLGSATATDAYGTVTAFAGARPSGVPSSLAASSGTFYLAPNGSGGVQFLTSTPSRAGVTHDFYWNNNDYRVIQPQTTRATLFGSGEYSFTPNLTLFGDLSYYRAKSKTYREPDSITRSTDGYIIVPASNPWNPFGTRFWSPTGAPNADGTARLAGTPSAVSITNKRLTDLMQRTASVDDEVFRSVGGVRGRLFDSWTWEGAVLYSQAEVTDEEVGPSRKSKLIQAINETDPVKAYNPFNQTFAVQNGTIVATGAYSSPESVQSTFRSTFIREGLTKLASTDLRVSGDLLPIWGGNVIGTALGGEFRYERYDDTRPPYAGLNPADSGLDPTANDFLGFSPNADTHGSRHVAAGYVEVNVPLAGRKFTLPLVHSLTLTASARTENYSDFGTTTKPKFGADWRPVPWILVRGSYNQGFHAPNLAQLFTGTLTRVSTGSTDSYRSAVTGLATDGASNRRNVASGNPNLQPEKSTGKSAGLVIEVPKVKGLSIGLDYWQISQTDVIAASGSIADDTQALNAATQAALAAGQSIDRIDLGSGTDHYLGDQSVVRLPVTPADRDFFAAYNATRAPANQRAVVGAIDYLRTTYFNRSSQFVNGLDLDLTYRVPALPLGNVTLNMTWTKLIDFHAYNSAGAARTELLGTNSDAVGGATPRWRGSAGLSWRRGAWSAGFSAYYIGDYTDSGATTTRTIYESLGQPDYIVPVFTNGSMVYRYRVRDSISYNASVSYHVRSRHAWLDDTTIRLGVVNLLNAEPPLSSDSRGYDPALYNLMARGQSWSLQLTRRF